MTQRTLVQSHGMNKPVKQHKGSIFVGLSGGVDSAVTAGLLKEAGHDVVGVFIKGWYPPELPCTWKEDRRDAMRVAAKLGIPFQTLDASAEYKKSVIDYLIREYALGRTPNPDIFCNRDVKFGAFYNYAREQGVNYIATGHYAKTETGRLYRGSNVLKDQSYFLWAIPKDALVHTLFPLGHMEKHSVRALAHTMRLPVAEKKDSQGICFLGPVSLDEFLRAETSVAPGVARNEDGKEVGVHDGAILYTLGERVKLISGNAGPWFVAHKDLAINELIVTTTCSKLNANKPITLSQTNFFTAPIDGKLYRAQYRYHGPEIKGAFDGKKRIFTPQTTLPELLAPGQSLVLYDNDECIGGGIIQ